MGTVRMSAFRVPGDHGGRSSTNFRSSSASSLPRSPTSMDPPIISDRKFGTSQRSSVSVMEMSESEMDHKKTLQELNTRLVSYVEKVRKLQLATDVIDAIPKHQGMDEQSLMSMKKKFETEISEWKVKLTEAQNVIAQLKIEINNLEQENKNLNLKYDKFDGREIILIGHKRLVPFRVNDKVGILRERDAHIANLESEINEILSKLNLLQNEKGKLMDNEAVYKSDIADLRKELDHSRKSYDKEKMKNADLETQLTTLDQDMKFKIQLLETELQEEKSRNKIDFNAIDRQLKSDYENRLRAEMDSLRKVYEEQTEKAKTEYMMIHSKKLTELQDQLSRERSGGLASRNELEDWRSRVDQNKAIIQQLESDKLVLQQKLQQQYADLNSKLEEQGSTFRSQMKSKDTEVVLLQKDITKLRAEYENLVEIKQALALEISIYKNIIEGEEKRIRKVSRKFSRMTTEKSNYESFSESDGEPNGFKSVDDVDGRNVYVTSSHKSHRTMKTSRSNY